MRSLLSHLWCRIFYGHIMLPYGSPISGKMMYMCARCLLCQELHDIK